jgi:tRNA U34 5-methylaminomethyl-2-thiouridine-forming methyltransferase MnmC
MAETGDIAWLDNLTPKSTRFDDTYYTRTDGLNETRYVFIDGNALPVRWSQGQNPVIGELGFGTGLNFLATRQAHDQINSAIATNSHGPHEDKSGSRENALIKDQNPDRDNHARKSACTPLTFVSFEKYPMSSEDLARALSPWEDLAPYAAELIQQWRPDKSGWQQLHFEGATLHLFIGDALVGLATIPATIKTINAWYLDGFNPRTNPDLWSLELLQAVRHASSSSATLASYTAAGWVRRNLAEAGFAIEKRKGFGHKRDMIIGQAD